MRRTLLTAALLACASLSGAVAAPRAAFAHTITPPEPELVPTAAYPPGARGDAPVARGQQFLVRTQRDDGAWLVHGTKSGKKDREQETAVYWGATWAVLGLTAGLPVE